MSKLVLIAGARMAALDAALMSPAVGFSLGQLMELAGLAVATAIARQYPASKRILCVAGPGNNGGDGLVASRHLRAWGFEPVIVAPKRPSRPESKDLFDGLFLQLDAFGVPVLEAMPAEDAIIRDFDLILDAVFGFSYAGALRPPFDAIIRTMAAVSDAAPMSSAAAIGADGAASAVDSSSSAAATSPRRIPVVSVDVPSGWDVDAGDVHGTGLQPSMLVSLTGVSLHWPAAVSAGLLDWYGSAYCCTSARLCRPVASILL